MEGLFLKLEILFTRVCANWNSYETCIFFTFCKSICMMKVASYKIYNDIKKIADESTIKTFTMQF